MALTQDHLNRWIIIDPRGIVVCIRENKLDALAWLSRKVERVLLGR